MKKGMLKTLLAASIVSVSSFAGISVNQAFAASPTYTSQSYYINDTYGWGTSTTSPIYNLGKNYNGSSGGVVILDFGEQQPPVNGNYGALSPGGQDVRYDYQIVNMVNAFIQGYNDFHSNGPSIIVAIGTNNDGPTSLDFSAAGKDWWDNVVGKFANSSIGNVSKVEGANDLEGWTDASPTTSWVDAYNNEQDSATNYQDKRHLWDFGDEGFNENSTWSTYSAYYYAWGATHDIPLPEIYFQYQATDWGTVHSQYAMTFYGPTTMDGGYIGSSQTLTAQQSYDDLNTATNGAFPSWGGYETTMN